MAEIAAATAHLSPPAPEGIGIREAEIHSMDRGKKPNSPIVGKDPSAARIRFRSSETKSAIRERVGHMRPRRDRVANNRKFGDNFPIGNSRFARFPNYDPDCDIDSLEYSFSSSDKENVNTGRKRHLDDALFEFFRKQAMKSLKNNFSNFCHHNEEWAKIRRLNGHDIGRDDFICYSTNCVDTVSSQIIVDECKIIPLSKDCVHHVIGLPNNGYVPMPDSDGGAKFIMSMFGLTELPHITFFGNKLKSKEVLTDKEVFVCFMVVAFKCFLLPTFNDYPNTDFLSILQEPASAIGVDFCLLVYEHLISGLSKFSKICKFNGRKPKAIEFCSYALAVYYLDSLDFGARMVDPSVPRISVWKGSLIKFFSDLDHKKNNLFGKRQLKKKLAPCYREFGDVGDCKSENDPAEQPESFFSAGFKHSLHKRFGKSIESKIIDGIVESVRSAQLEKLQSIEKCELLVTNVLNVLMGCKSDDDKSHNVLGRDNCTSDHAITESDVASKLVLVSPNVFSKITPRSNVGNTFIHNPASPDFVSCKAAAFGTFITAPAIQPMHKVRSRLPISIPEEHALPSLHTHPSGVKDSRSSLYMSSPISRINFSPPLNDKDRNAPCISKVGNVSNNDHGRKFNVNVSKYAPIAVADSSSIPKLVVQPPDVHATGPSSFSFRQADLAKNVDHLYNNMVNDAVMQEIEPAGSKLDIEKSEGEYIDLSQHAFEDRIEKDDLVILQPKNSLALPLIQNGRFPVSHLDIKHFCAIVDLAYTKGVQKTYAVKYPKVHCSYISLGQSLMIGGHIDNFLIPVFCRKLFEDNHPSKSGRQHFFSLVGESILDYENDAQLSFVQKAFLGAASASKGKRLELSDRLFFPICRMRHWFTFSVDFKCKSFIFLDSLFNKDDDFHSSIKKRLINNFIKLWKIIFRTKENMFKDFGVMYANVPKQDNADDCGVFTMKFMEIFKPELNMHRFFSKADIVNIRIQFANKLFFCKRNNTNKSLVLDYVS